MMGKNFKDLRGTSSNVPPGPEDVQAVPTQIQTLRETLQHLHDTIKPPEPAAPAESMATNAPPNANTYAAATKAAPRPAVFAEDAHTTAKSQAKSLLKPKARTARPRIKSSPPTRLIIDMDQERPIITPVHPDDICKALNAALPSPARVGGLTWSRNCNLIVHPAPPCTAEVLKGH
ncbi:hypothetical protein B0H13DRAFT_1899449 [Mycena leptocephala]|nr:hypothetical protein B0H13DRAFT_1899449 [Mycena leptocephala]